MNKKNNEIPEKLWNNALEELDKLEKKIGFHRKMNRLLLKVFDEKHLPDRNTKFLTYAIATAVSQEEYGIKISAADISRAIFDGKVDIALMEITARCLDELGFFKHSVSRLGGKVSFLIDFYG